jgi:hypothetical protein
MSENCRFAKKLAFWFSKLFLNSRKNTDDMVRVATCRKNSRTCFEEKSDFMCTLLRYDYYLILFLVYKKILNTRGNCSIKRDAGALLSLCSLCYVSCLRERYQIQINKSKTSDKTTAFLVSLSAIGTPTTSHLVKMELHDWKKEEGTNSFPWPAFLCPFLWSGFDSRANVKQKPFYLFYIDH